MAYAINIEDFKKAKVSQILIMCNVITFVILNVILKDTDILLMFTQEKTAIFSGEYWRLVSSIFIHWDIGHLLNNMIGLLLYGTILELQFSTSSIPEGTLIGIVRVTVHGATVQVIFVEVEL